MEKYLLFNHLDIYLQLGKPITFLSPSSCGKSTLAKLLCALSPPSNEQILINHQSLQNFDIRGVHKTIIDFSQSPRLYFRNHS
ncbi:ATP-binding cassette domain-containing protein [Bartonella koehlerae]|uniref:ATP-binding cassette domain-containing protein n=1 Tax=Bartonella koehlerae TaxID=92181 RepID=UPI001FDA9ADE|nr:ATP-binding cassette domain-containing protein [Bartonella koehlerae]